MPAQLLKCNQAKPSRGIGLPCASAGFIPIQPLGSSCTEGQGGKTAHNAQPRDQDRKQEGVSVWQLVQPGTKPNRTWGRGGYISGLLQTDIEKATICLLEPRNRALQHVWGKLAFDGLDEAGENPSARQFLLQLRTVPHWMEPQAQWQDSVHRKSPPANLSGSIPFSPKALLPLLALHQASDRLAGQKDRNQNSYPYSSFKVESITRTRVGRE